MAKTEKGHGNRVNVMNKLKLQTQFVVLSESVLWLYSMFAFHSVDLGWIPLSNQTKGLKNWYSELPCLTFRSIKGIMWRTSRQVRLLCPWALRGYTLRVVYR